MERDMESRLASLEAELAEVRSNRQLRPAKRKVSRKKLLSLFGISFIAIVIAGGWHAYRSVYTQQMPIPRSIINESTVAVYYPKELPRGFTFEKDSSRYANGTLFYSLRNDDTVLGVTTQPKPPNDLRLDTLEHFKAYKAPLGTAYIGKQKETAAGILMTDGEMVTVSGPAPLNTQTIMEVLLRLQRVQ